MHLGLHNSGTSLSQHHVHATVQHVVHGNPQRRSRSSIFRKVLANSTPENIARPPTWSETIRGAIFWAKPSNWDSRPHSWYLTLVFVVMKIVGTIGGYRGRAFFARGRGLEKLDEMRGEAAASVDATEEKYLNSMPSLAAKVKGEGAEVKPCIAVVLPTFVRTRADVAEFRATLYALQAQTQQPDVVLVVDDASPADISKEIEKVQLELQAAGSKMLLGHVRMAANTGPSGARTVGLRLLRKWAGLRRVIACFTDSDAVPTDTWCEEMQKAQDAFPGIICGPTLSLTKSYTGQFHDHFGNLNGRWKWQDPPAVLIYGCTCNYSVDVPCIGELEFDPVFRRPGFEDIELCWRARKERGVLTRHCEGARVYHDYDRGLRGLYRQFWKYGNTEPIMAYMHPDFSFQDSRPVVAGFQDPRLQVLKDTIPQGSEKAAEAVLRKMYRLFQLPPSESGVNAQDGTTATVGAATQNKG